MDISEEQFDQLEKDAPENGKSPVEFEEKLIDKNGEVVAIAEVKYVLLKF